MMTQNGSEEKAAWRRDPTAAREVLEQLLPNENERNLQVRFFVDCLRRADAINPRAWTITQRSSKVCLLFDGLWVCALRGRGLQVALASSVTPGAAAIVSTLEPESEYKSMPGTGMFLVSSDKLEDPTTRETLLDGVEKFLDQLRNGDATSGQIRTHSP